LFGEQLIVHTAHEFPTANESFLRLEAVFQNWDDLRSKVLTVTYGNGAQKIEMRNGARILYKARTGGAARGYSKVDLTVYDEAQHIKVEHVSASGPAKLANPNAQSWYAGSGGLETSAQAWKFRKMALKGNAGRLAYTEHTAERVSLTEQGKIRSVRPADVLDRRYWVEAMPGYGLWVSDESMEALYLELGGDGEKFAREALCVWDIELGAEELVIPVDRWMRAADTDSRLQDPVCFAIDVAPERSSAAVAVAGRRSDGLIHGELVQAGAGTDWVVPRVTSLAKKWRHVAVVLQETAAAGALVEPLKKAGVTVKPMTVGDTVQACGEFFDDVVVVDKDGRSLPPRFRHLDQPELNTALFGAVKREVGDAWAWHRKASSADVSPLMAVTLARWGFLRYQQRRPRIHTLKAKEVTA